MAITIWDHDVNAGWTPNPSGEPLPDPVNWAWPHPAPPSPYTLAWSWPCAAPYYDYATLPMPDPVTGLDPTPP